MRLVPARSGKVAACHMGGAASLEGVDCVRVHQDMRPLERFFAPKLVRLLDAVAASNLGMAVPGQSYTHRPSGCMVEVLNGFDDTIGVLVRISYTAPEKQWSDVINLERTPDSWLINNVFYEQGGNLRFRLFEALD